MKSPNKRKRPNHFTRGKIVKSEYDDSHYTKHLSVKKISTEHYEADKYWIMRYNLEKVCKNGFTYDGNWFSARESREWNEVYDRYNRRRE